MAELDSLWKHDPNEAERIITEYKALGYNHVPTGPIIEHGYHGHYPDTNWLGEADRFADFLAWLRSHEIEYTLFLFPDFWPWFHGTGVGWDHALIEAQLVPFYRHPRIQALTKRVCVAWEQWASIPEMVKVFDLMRMLFPDAERYWHNGPGHDAPCNNTEHSLDGWVSAAAHGVTGYYFQAHPPETQPSELDGRTPLEMMMYDLWDAVRRLHGNGSPWGNPPVLTPRGELLKVVYFEGIAHGQYWHDNYTHIAQAWHDGALSVAGVAASLDG